MQWVVMVHQKKLLMELFTIINQIKKTFYKIFGDKNEIEKYINNKIDKSFYEIIHTKNIVKSTDSPLEAAKRGKDTSMWLSIESVKKEADIVISAGNTGALLSNC